ncbi:Uncharacterised protein [Candidatus Anstonella stagnisolia]|nr:Uncharacterised protein [Candidatus Anstonella stagnisolia]
MASTYNLPQERKAEIANVLTALPQKPPFAKHLLTRLNSGASSFITKDDRRNLTDLGIRTSIRNKSVNWVSLDPLLEQHLSRLAGTSVLAPKEKYFKGFAGNAFSCIKKGLLKSAIVLPIAFFASHLSYSAFFSSVASSGIVTIKSVGSFLLPAATQVASLTLGGAITLAVILSGAYVAYSHHNAAKERKESIREAAGIKKPNATRISKVEEITSEMLSVISKYLKPSALLFTGAYFLGSIVSQGTLGSALNATTGLLINAVSSVGGAIYSLGWGVPVVFITYEFMKLRYEQGSKTSAAREKARKEEEDQGALAYDSSMASPSDASRPEQASRKRKFSSIHPKPPFSALNVSGLVESAASSSS